MHLFFDSSYDSVWCDLRIDESEANAADSVEHWLEAGRMAHHHVDHRGPIHRWMRDAVPVPRSLATASCSHWARDGAVCRRLVSHHIDLYGLLDDAVVYVERQFYCRDHVGAVTLRDYGRPAFYGYDGDAPVTTTLELDQDLHQTIVLLVLSRRQPFTAVMSDLLRQGLRAAGRRTADSFTTVADLQAAWNASDEAPPEPR